MALSDMERNGVWATDPDLTEEIRDTQYKSPLGGTSKHSTFGLKTQGLVLAWNRRTGEMVERGRTTNRRPLNLEAAKCKAMVGTAGYSRATTTYD
jgi:hypothetical protein